jgi:peptidyl-tRNA hydrolase
MKPEEIRQYKQIILIRSDVKMDCGKKCVQVAHASVMGYDLGRHDIVVGWRENGMRKIVLKVDNLEQLEVKKCKVLCANHHKLLHWNEKQRVRNLMEQSADLQSRVL